MWHLRKTVRYSHKLQTGGRGRGGREGGRKMLCIWWLCVCVCVVSLTVSSSSVCFKVSFISLNWNWRTLWAWRSRSNSWHTHTKGKWGLTTTVCVSIAGDGWWWLVMVMVGPNWLRQTSAHPEPGSVGGFFLLKGVFPPPCRQVLLFVGTVGFFSITKWGLDLTL